MKINLGKLIHWTSLSCLTIALIIVGPVSAYADCFMKPSCDFNGSGDDSMCSIYNYDRENCERNRVCCNWTETDVGNSNVANAQNNNQGQLTGTIWQGAKVESVVKQSAPLVFTPQVGLPGFMDKYVFSENSTAPIAKLMKAIFNYGIQTIGLITLIVIIFGGFMWSTAGGNGNKVSEAKQWLFSGLGGLLLLMFSYLILRTINIDLVNFKTRDIAAITKLNLIVAEKSNQEQVLGDQGFLDGTYGYAACDNGVPDKEACCVFYNEESALSLKPDVLRAFSLAYCEQNGGQQKAVNKCLEFGKKQSEGDPGGNGALYQDNMSEKTDGSTQFYNRFWNSMTTRNPNTKISEWSQSNYETQQEDLGLYFIRGKACWNFSIYVADATIGLDSSRYCSEVAGNNNGWACIVTNNGKKSWGYCDDETCRPCSSFGKDCDHDYECPNRKALIGNSTVVAEWQCGNGGLSGLTNNAATCDEHFCECANNECFNECSRNLTAAGQQSKIDDVCKGR